MLLHNTMQYLLLDFFCNFTDYCFILKIVLSVNLAEKYFALKQLSTFGTGLISQFKQKLKLIC